MTTSKNDYENRRVAPRCMPDRHLKLAVRVHRPNGDTRVIHAVIGDYSVVGMALFVQERVEIDDLVMLSNPAGEGPAASRALYRIVRCEPSGGNTWKLGAEVIDFEPTEALITKYIEVMRIRQAMLI